jgi:hypothetical protein
VHDRRFEFEWDEIKAAVNVQKRVRMYELFAADAEMPEEVDFSKGKRGLHHIPEGAKVYLPAAIERSVWEYFAGNAEEKGVELSQLLSDVLKRDIEINEALK